MTWGGVMRNESTEYTATTCYNNRPQPTEKGKGLILDAILFKINLHMRYAHQYMYKFQPPCPQQ